MTIKTQDVRVPTGHTVDLARWPTRVTPAYASKKEYRRCLDKQVEELSSLQRLPNASNGYAALLMCQGMDAAGKDR